MAIVASKKAELLAASGALQATNDEFAVDNTSALEAGTTVVGTTSVLANDVRGSGGSLTVVAAKVGSSSGFTDLAGASLTLQGLYGELTIAADGTYRYAPDDAYDLVTTPVSDSFAYEVSDWSQTSTGILTVDIAAAAGTVVAAPGAALEALSPSRISAFATAGFRGLQSTRGGIVLTAAQAKAVADNTLTITAPAGTTISVQDGDQAIASLTPSEIGALSRDGVTSLSSTDGRLEFNVSQAFAIEAPLTVSALVYVAIIGGVADIEALTPTQIAQAHSRGFTEVLSNGSLQLTVAQALAYADNSMAFAIPGGQKVTLADTPTNLASLTPDQAATLQTHGVAIVTGNDDLASSLVGQPLAGNVLSNDRGFDAQDTLTVLTVRAAAISGSPTQTLDPNGPTVIQGAHGTLTISRDGSYQYVATSPGLDIFTYDIVDTLGVRTPDVSALSINIASATGGQGYGDVHYSTFDGAAFDLQATGLFLVSRAIQGPTLVVQSLQEGTGGVSFYRGLAVRAGDHTVAINLDSPDPLQIDGAAAQMSVSGSLDLGRGASLSETSAGVYRIGTSAGDVVEIDDRGEYLDLAVHPGVQRAPGSFVGLLGNDDGQPQNDFAPFSGQVPSSSPGPQAINGAFADHWRIGATDSMFTGRPTGPHTPPLDDRPLRMLG